MSTIDERSKVAKQIVDLQKRLEEEGRDWTSEEQETFDRLVADQDRLRKKQDEEESVRRLFPRRKRFLMKPITGFFQERATMRIGDVRNPLH